METKQSGFTLTELVVTITIVGILAAVAVPRLVGLGGDARGGVIKSTAGAMKQANDTIFTKASIANIAGLSSGAGGPSIPFPAGDGTANTVPISIHFGFATSAAELAKALALGVDLSPTTDTANGAIQHNKAQTPATCKVSYTQAANSTTSPVYTIVTGNCS